MSYIGNSPSANRLRFTPQATQPTNAQEGDVYYDDGTNRQEGLYQFKNTAWVLVGSGTNDSIVQYITNGDAETGVTSGWATYADAAGVAPVNGTGGVANVTISASSVNPLRGQFSFLLSKDANNRQGQGWSYDFSINDADKAKVLTINFDYVVNSGTFAAGSNTALSDVVVYIYDVTNSTLIQPSSIKLFSNSSTISDVFEAQFQTSATGSDYRLILHVASTSASAYELKVDNVRVSPSQYVFGTPITDWQSYTPTTNGLGTVSSVNFFWRRVGDSVQVQGSLVAGTTTAVEARIGLPFTTASSSKQPPIQIAGDVTTTSNIAGGYTALVEQSVSYLTFGAETAALPGLTKQNGSAIFSTGSTISVNATVAVAGFSSSVQTSDNADTRVVAFAATTSTTAATANVTPINFTSILGDTHGAYSAGTYTVPVSGWYKINGQTYTAAAHTAYIYVDGVSVAQGGNVGSAAQASEVNALRPLTAGQTIQIRIDASQTISGGAVINRFSVERVTGPSAIAATETIALSVNTSTTAATANVTPINFTNVLRDTHNAYSSGTYTVPASGLYLIHAQTFTAAAHTAYIYIDNTSAAQGSNIGSASQASDVFALRPLTAGQTIQIRIDASQTLSGGAIINRFSIIRQGIS